MHFFEEIMQIKGDDPIKNIFQFCWSYWIFFIFITEKRLIKYSLRNEPSPTLFTFFVCTLCTIAWNEKFKITSQKLESVFINQIFLIMSKTSESGHAKNMTNLETLISAITLFGEKYNPSKRASNWPLCKRFWSVPRSHLMPIMLPKLLIPKRLMIGKSLLNPQQADHRCQQRPQSFRLRTWSIESVQSMIRKLQGRRASAKLTKRATNRVQSRYPLKTQISTAQMSCNFRIRKFRPPSHSTRCYSRNLLPNEDELKIGTLQSLLAVLQVATSRRDRRLPSSSKDHVNSATKPSHHHRPG